MNIDEASLYIHVPFCEGYSGNSRGKCAYCDFYSVAVRRDSFRPGFFVETLLGEGKRLFESFPEIKKIPTVYIGGGTPSLLGPEAVCRLLAGLGELFERHLVSFPEEITMEANPESADEAFLEAARKGGVTRLSLGVESFYGPSRRAARRIGDESLLHPRLRLAAGYFPRAFSADLITALPLQDEKILAGDIAALTSYNPGHVSLYALTVEPENPLAVFFTRDEADRLWLSGRDALERAGYRQYEVSNFCREAQESRHNIRYWRMRNWLALGPAASATIICDEAGRGLRYTIPPDADAWLAAGGCAFFREPGARAETFTPITEELDSRTLIKETLLMGYRYIEGPDEALFTRRFHKPLEDCIPETLKAWRARGLLRNDKNALSKEGLLFLNPFLLDAFEELDASPARKP